VLGAAHLGTGDDAAAEAALNEARTLASTISNPWLGGHANYHLGELARRRGDSAKAEDLHHAALTERTKAGLRPGVAESLEALAGLAADQESLAEAARLFGAASTLRDGMGLARWPADQAGYDADVATLRRGLGEDAFGLAWAEGAALTLDDAVAYASRARGERKRPSTGWASLTPTELEVVKLVAKGFTNPEIGERLFIGRGTVKNHLAHIFTKLGHPLRTGGRSHSPEPLTPERRYATQKVEDDASQGPGKGHSPRLTPVATAMWDGTSPWEQAYGKTNRSATSGRARDGRP
jgi:DNA-binding CsgD family transcriptional regulator